MYFFFPCFILVFIFPHFFFDYDIMYARDTDKFGQSVFRESLRRAFERQPSPPTDDPSVQAVPGPLQMGFGSSIEVLHSREFKIAGAVGPCASLKKTGSSVAETEVGIGYVHNSILLLYFYRFSAFILLNDILFCLYFSICRCYTLLHL
jgi:hypothetical protein